MRVDRRSFLKGAAVAGGAAMLGGALLSGSRAQDVVPASSHNGHYGHGNNMTVGELSTEDFDPYVFLTQFDRGTDEGSNGKGGRIRRFRIEAADKTIEIAPGVPFNAWALNGQVPGPTLRVTEGDTVVIDFINNGSHPHTLHFHGFHEANMDGVPPLEVGPGGQFEYRFEAEPYGVHLYHCHSTPLKRHIHKGLYGAYIVDPKEGWGDPAHEMVFIMNAFDTNFDGENDVYAVNSKAFAYARKPIAIKKGELQRAFVVNVTEFDAVNSVHLHGNFFRYWEIGHKYDRAYAPANASRFTDNVSMIQGERGLLEFRYDRLGDFMFHAHQSEFVELGWMSLFRVSE